MSWLLYIPFDFKPSYGRLKMLFIFSMVKALFLATFSCGTTYFLRLCLILMMSSHLSRIDWFLILKQEVKFFFETNSVVGINLTTPLCVNLITTFHVLSALWLPFFMSALNVVISFSQYSVNNIRLLVFFLIYL